MFIDLRAPPTTLWSMCLPQTFCFLSGNQARLDLFEHVCCGCCRCLAIFESRCKIIKCLSICSNDYASESRINILCKQMCCIAPHVFFVFSQLTFLGNSWDERTLAGIST